MLCEAPVLGYERHDKRRSILLMLISGFFNNADKILAIKSTEATRSKFLLIFVTSYFFLTNKGAPHYNNTVESYREQGTNT